MRYLVFLILFAIDGTRDKCDLKKVEDGRWCDGCSKILDAKEIIDKDFCRKCDNRTKTKKVQVCVKHAYLCEVDSENSWKAGKCRKCKTDFKEVWDKSIVSCYCEGCGKEAEREGPCPDCRKTKKRFVKRCQKSGTFPHVAEK